MTRRLYTLASLPLFANDAALAEAIMGAGKTVEWRNAAALLEARGLPKIDPLMGGRYVPGVLAFFAGDNERPQATATRPAASVEHLGAWKREKNQRRSRPA